MDDVGTRLKAVRKLSGFSQRELAKRAGVTNSTISMIEKNNVSPSVSSLRKVLSGLPMTLLEFFDTDDKDNNDLPVVYTPAQFQRTKTNDVCWDLIGKHFPNPQLGFMLETYPSQADTGDEGYSHDGEEAGYVISGKIEITVDDQVFELNAGDGYYFASHRPHRFRNPFSEPCVLVSANTPAHL
ncbi:MAG: cupin domain-containing protein [Reinekea forsetii]|nr:cupin domain-containing protein [Reinekea forsetii]MDO7640865.1 cupin domain-containing protein [Reinekea forsetii]MDO7644438.1 cupin domain-containing protein [Reinekea forsetii]